MDCVTQSVNQNDIRLKVHFVKQSNREKWFWVINRERFIISNPNRLLRPTQLMTRNIEFDSNIRSNMGPKLSHPIQSGRVQIRPKTDSN